MEEYGDENVPPSRQEGAADIPTPHTEEEELEEIIEQARQGSEKGNGLCREMQTRCQRFLVSPSHLLSLVE
jgi:hypothetical protein